MAPLAGIYGRIRITNKCEEIGINTSKVWEGVNSLIWAGLKVTAVSASGWGFGVVVPLTKPRGVKGAALAAWEDIVDVLAAGTASGVVEGVKAGESTFRDFLFLKNELIRVFH